MVVRRCFSINRSEIIAAWVNLVDCRMVLRSIRSRFYMIGYRVSVKLFGYRRFGWWEKIELIIFFVHTKYYITLMQILQYLTTVLMCVQASCLLPAEDAERDKVDHHAPDSQKANLRTKFE